MLTNSGCSLHGKTCAACGCKGTHTVRSSIPLKLTGAQHSHCLNILQAHTVPSSIPPVAASQHSADQHSTLLFCTHSVPRSIRAETCTHCAKQHPPGAHVCMRHSRYSAGTHLPSSIPCLASEACTHCAKQHSALCATQGLPHTLSQTGFSA
jgi:hypothetical protein